jgi:4-azaleucine resistance transporter AzlC
MLLFYRTLGGRSLRQVSLVCLSVAVMGVSYGISAHAAGIPLWANLLLATTVLAGASEFLFIASMHEGVLPVVAALAGILVNARNLIYGFAVSPSIGPGWRRWVGAHLVNDESVALSSAEASEQRRRLLYWVTGIGVLVAWPFGAVLGGTLGALIADPSAFGFDAVLPAVLLAVVMPALRDSWTRGIALLGALLACGVTPLVPVGVAPILSLVALPLVLLQRKDST